MAHGRGGGYHAKNKKSKYYSMLTLQIRRRVNIRHEVLATVQSSYLYYIANHSVTAFCYLLLGHKTDGVSLCRNI